MANLVLKISTSDSKQNVRNLLSNNSKTLPRILQKMGEMASPSCEIQLLNGDAAKATGTFTIDNSLIAADDVVTIGDITYTAKASGATGHQFNIGGSATITAAALALLINSNAAVDFGGKVSANSAAGVVTITANTPGFMGNLIATSVTVAAAGIVASGTRLGGGADDSASSVNSKNF